MPATDDAVIGGTQPREMHYLGVCLTCEEEKIREMLRRTRQIFYSAARRAIGPAVLDDWAATVEVAVDPYWRGLQLKGNHAVAFCRSRYDGFHCVYIVHERIRHIFYRSLL